MPTLVQAGIWPLPPAAGVAGKASGPMTAMVFTWARPSGNFARICETRSGNQTQLEAEFDEHGFMQTEFLKRENQASETTRMEIKREPNLKFEIAIDNSYLYRIPYLFQLLFADRAPYARVSFHHLL
jgi:hypothetical protein